MLIATAVWFLQQYIVKIIRGGISNLFGWLKEASEIRQSSAITL